LLITTATLIAILSYFLLNRRHPRSTLFPYTTLFRSYEGYHLLFGTIDDLYRYDNVRDEFKPYNQEVHSLSNTKDDLSKYRQLKSDRKSTRLNSSHVSISYAVFCLKKKKKHERAMCRV